MNYNFHHGRGEGRARGIFSPGFTGIVTDMREKGNKRKHIANHVGTRREHIANLVPRSD